jgi:hypothetical protein
MAASETGLLLDIYRGAGIDCSNHGISSRTDRVTLVGILDRRRARPRVEPIPASEAGPFPPHDGAPAVVLVYRDMGGRRICHVEPLMPEGPAVWLMHGGTYVSGDSRFSNLIDMYGAVAFHDRQEAWES